MKKHLNYLRKALCFVLSLVLLSSNVQIYAQGVSHVQRVLPPEAESAITKKLDNVESLLAKLESDTKRLIDWAKGMDGLYLTDKGYIKELNKLSGEISEFERSYSLLLADIGYYSKELKAQLAGLGTNFHDNVLEALTSKYYGKSSIIEPAGIIRVKDIVIPEAYDFRALISDILSKADKGAAIEEQTIVFEQLINRFHMNIDLTAKAQLDVLRQQSESYFKSLNKLAKIYKEDELWEFVLSRISKQDQERLKLVLRAGEDRRYFGLARDIKKYLRAFKGNADEGLLSTLKLTRKLKGLKAEERIRTVDRMTKLERGQVNFAEDVLRNRPKNIGRLLKVGSPLMIVGVVLTAVSITEVNAQNVFPPFAGIREKEAIKKAIENDEEVSAVSALRWYMDPINKGTVQNNRAHYLNLVSLFLAATEAEEDQEGIINVINEMDPDPGLETAQVQERVEQEFSATLEQYS